MFQYIHNTLDRLDIPEDGVIIDHFAHAQGKKSVYICEGVTHCDYFYITENTSLDLEIAVQSPGAHIQLYGLVFGQGGEEMVCHTELIVQANDIQADIHLISIVQE